MTSNVTPITHLLHADLRRGNLLLPTATSSSALSLFLFYLPSHFCLLRRYPSSTTVTSRLLQNNPRHRQVCEGMNEKLQGGLVKFLLPPPLPQPFAFNRSLSFSLSAALSLSVRTVCSLRFPSPLYPPSRFSFVSAVSLRTSRTRIPMGSVITAGRLLRLLRSLIYLQFRSLYFTAESIDSRTHYLSIAGREGKNTRTTEPRRVNKASYRIRRRGPVRTPAVDRFQLSKEMKYTL